ncbi:MAG: hypothetical protein N3D79_01975 [Acidilobaceae archaeon]|nr:hypothetical protein [Acidilobaceae archaeon]
MILLLFFFFTLPFLEVSAQAGSSYYPLPAVIEISFTHSSERYVVTERLIATPLCIHLLASNLRYGPGASSSVEDEERLRQASCIGHSLAIDLSHAEDPKIKINGKEIPGKDITLRVRWLTAWETVIRMARGASCGKGG